MEVLPSLTDIHCPTGTAAEVEGHPKAAAAAAAQLLRA
jgi:hypothetical protein